MCLPMDPRGTFWCWHALLWSFLVFEWACNQASLMSAAAPPLPGSVRSR